MRVAKSEIFVQYKKKFPRHSSFQREMKYYFKSNAAFQKAVPKYIILAVVLVLIPSALPAYSQALFIRIGIPQGLAPTLANILNILLQVLISNPSMKFIIMKE